jgi:hypothetical protein
MGWGGLTGQDRAAAARLVDIGRQQQEARTWIALWRSRRGAPRAGEVLRPLSIAAQQREQDVADLGRVEEMGRQLAALLRPDVDAEEVPEERRVAVDAVYAALERAQRAAEEAAMSSSALEKAIEQAESAGALSSDDEEEPPGAGGEVEEEEDSDEDPLGLAGEER